MLDSEGVFDLGI